MAKRPINICSKNVQYFEHTREGGPPYALSRILLLRVVTDASLRTLFSVSQTSKVFQTEQLFPFRYSFSNSSKPSSGFPSDTLSRSQTSSGFPFTALSGCRLPISSTTLLRSTQLPQKEQISTSQLVSKYSK